MTRRECTWRFKKLDPKIKARLLAVFKELGGEELQRPRMTMRSSNKAQAVVKRDEIIQELQRRFRMDLRCLVLAEEGWEPLLSKDYQRKAADAVILRPLSTTIIAAMLRMCHSTISKRGKSL